MPWNILQVCHYSMSPTVSVQGKFRSMHYNNRKGERDLLQSILKTQSEFYLLVSRNKVFSHYIQRIETRFAVVVEVFEVDISFDFEFCPEEDFIEFW